MEGLRQSDVAPIGQRCDDQPWRVSEVFVRVDKLSVTNINVTMVFFLRPTMPELFGPLKRVFTFGFLRDQGGTDIPCVNIDCTDGHDFFVDHLWLVQSAKDRSTRSTVESVFSGILS